MSSEHLNSCCCCWSGRFCRDSWSVRQT